MGKPKIGSFERDANLPADATAQEIANEASQLAGFGLPESFLKPIDEYTDRSEQSFVIQDEWYGQLESGDPFEDAAKPYKDANPDKHFRYLGARTMGRHGTRGYVPVRRADGKSVTVSGMVLAQIPKPIRDERVKRLEVENREVMIERQQQAQEDLTRAVVDSGGDLAVLNSMDTQDTVSHGFRS